jgi:ribose transport system permease protein
VTAATSRRRVTGVPQNVSRSLLGLAPRFVGSPPALLAMFIILLCIVFSSLRGAFDTGSNAVTILSDSAVLGLISLGQTYVLISGGFDLSVSGVAPLAGVVFTLFSNQRIATPLDILLVIGIGALVGVINGAVITWAGINPLITTLGMLSVTGGAAYAVSSGVTVALNDPGAAFLNNALPGNIPFFVVVTIILAVLGALLLRFTTFGRSIYAMGANREAAWLAGIRVKGLTVVVYAICGSLAAFAGVVVASELLAGSGTVESSAALDSIAAVVLGGAALAGGEGSVTGTMLGVLVIGIIGNGLELLHISAFYQQIATGAILLLAVGVQRLQRVIRRSGGRAPQMDQPETPADGDDGRTAHQSVSALDDARRHGERIRADSLTDHQPR